MLTDHVFCLCCNLFWLCYANVVLYCDKTVSVNLFAEEEGEELGM